MIRRLRLENWLCFKGIHEIQLGAKVYAIAAKMDTNPERSNYLGKSSCMEAIRFALYGTHRHRTEDAWITNDASEGSVELELDSGLVITRSRKRGKRTEVKVEGATQKEADLAIMRVMGMSEEDFLATSYFEQRQMARFILARPADRMETVRAWTQLDELEKAYEQTMQAIRALQEGVKAQLAKRAVYEARLEVKVEPYDELKNRMLLTAVRSDLCVLRDKVREAREQANKYAKQADLEYVVRSGKELATQLKNWPDVSEQISQLDQKKGEVFARWTKVDDEYRRLQNARPFDGKCPVLRDECPVAKEVGKRCATDVELRKKVGAEHSEVEQEKRAISDELSKLSLKQQDRETSQRKLDALRFKRDLLTEQGISLSMPKPEPNDTLATRMRVLEQEEEALIRERAMHEQDTRIAEESKALIAALDKDIEEKRARIDILRATAQIFGRNGAQKVAAKGILDEIEKGANSALSECGIDLSVGLTWGETGEGWAKECEKCGAAFPTSAKVKECGTCGAERGQNILARLDVKLSDRSGAAEDMAGMAIQLAASGWLRRMRGATWDTALLDEPLSACDRFHVKQLSRHFATMLSGTYGFRQAIVVAHNPDVTYALPGRIEIEWKNGCPSMRVVE